MTDQPQRGRVLGALVNYGLGSYLPQVVNFLLVPIYTRYIDPSEMGILDIALSTQLFLSLVMRMGQPGAVARLYYDCDVDDRSQLRDLITTIAAAMVAISLAVGAIALLVGPFIFGRWMPDVPFFPYIALAVVGAVLSGAPEIQRRLLQAREHSGKSAQLSAMFGVISTTLTVLFVVVFHLKVFGVLLASVISSVVFAFVAWHNHRDDLRGRFELRKLKASLAYGLPLVPHHLAAWVQQNIGRFFLSATVSAASVGILGVATRVLAPISEATGAFSSAYAPVYFSWRSKLSAAEADREAKRIGGVVLVLGAVAVLGASTFGVWVIRHVMARSYSDAAPLVGVAGCALYFHLIYTLMTNEIFFSKRTQWISLIFILSAVTNSVLVLLIGEMLGAMGAALSQLAGGVVSVVLVGYVARRTFSLPIAVRPALASLFGLVIGALAPLWLPAGTVAIELAEQAALFLVAAATTLWLSGLSAQIAGDISSLLARRSRRAGATA